MKSSHAFWGNYLTADAGVYTPHNDITIFTPWLTGFLLFFSVD